MEQLYAEYGPALLTLVIAALGAVLTRLVHGKVKSNLASGMILRAIDEVWAAVREISQTYVKKIKEGELSDGRLTDDEKKEAMEYALAVAKANIGTKGLRRLARVLGLGNLDSWLTTQAESAVVALKASTPPKR